TKSGIKAIIQGMTHYAADTLWFGDALPPGGFDEYYAAAKGKADGKDRVAPKDLAARAQTSVNKIQGDIDRTRKAMGL
ncbi:MAG: hypothetical protein AAF772_14070, partial [Acidobacteriota bacterium]